MQIKWQQYHAQHLWPSERTEFLLAQLTAILANVSPQYQRDGAEKRFVYRKNGDGPMAVVDFLPPGTDRPREPEEGSEEWWDRKGAEHAAVMDKWRAAIAGQFAREPERAGWNDEEWISG